MPKVDVGSDLPKLEKTVDKLEDEAKKLATAYKKKSGEFEILNSGLFEGKDMIEDNQKKIKKEKDTKKIKELVAEIEAMEETFSKMSKKLVPVRKDAESLIDDAKKLYASLEDARSEVDDLQKALPRTGGRLDEIKDWDKSLKALGKQIGVISEKVALIKDDGLPNSPKL